ncbi:MAG TPA: phosphatidylserine/phosphatidylglycerophosphate/cardiolipin synthase family protein [Sphingomonadaceae bacterium]|nr:phosphatidylserine/phosphatidylglycerophosphate/cardiolipin synthase family protein [Sphingomonadaceae bacterium]
MDSVAIRPDEGRCDCIVEGNRLRLLVDGPARLEALIGLIDGARTTLRLLYYIYSDDEAGRRVRDALIGALDRGVAVALIIDGFGSDASDAFLAPLRDAGADLCRFIPGLGRRYLLRNHQKLALADEARAIIGGFNISGDYFGTTADNAWRDLGLALEGPAAARLAGYFDGLLRWAHVPRASMRRLRRALFHWSSPPGPVRWLFGGPTRRLSPWARTVKRDMRGARRLDLIAAYFVPNPAMMRRLERVARRGGEARVLTAALSDNGATVAAARHCYRRLLKAGVRIFEYQPAKLHTKLFVIDDAVHIGSANFDMRSLYINLEIMLRIADQQFAGRMRDYVDGELAQSKEITREAHRALSTLFNRVRWGLAYFLVAVLDYKVTRRLNFGAGER